MVASDTAHGHVLAWLARARRRRRRARSPTSPPTTRQLNVQGPRSREVLADADRRRPVDRGVRLPHRALDRGRRRARCCCARITYLGELGYELYVPAGRRPAACTTRCRPPARRTGCGRSGSRRWPRCGWRRATATSATTSTTPTARSRSGSASRSRWTSPAASSAATPCSPARRPTPRPAGWRSGWCRSGCCDPEPLLYHAEVVLPRRRGGRLRPRRVVRLDARRRRSAWPWSSGGGEPVTPDWLDGRRLGGRHRRRPAPGRGVAAADVRPDLRPGPGLTGPGQRDVMVPRFGQDRPRGRRRLAPDGGQRRDLLARAPPGAMLGITGAPGAGKSTLAAAVATRVAGAVGRPDGRLPPRRRRAAPARAARAQGCARDLRRVGVRRAAEPAARPPRPRGDGARRSSATSNSRWRARSRFRPRLSARGHRGQLPAARRAPEWRVGARAADRRRCWHVRHRGHAPTLTPGGPACRARQGPRRRPAHWVAHVSTSPTPSVAEGARERADLVLDLTQWQG